MKASKGFLLLDLAVMFLLVGTLLIFVIHSFNGCVSALNRTGDVRKAQILAEKALFNQVELPSNWQLLENERVVQGEVLKEVQIVDGKSGKIIFNLFWLQ